MGDQCISQSLKSEKRPFGDVHLLCAAMNSVRGTGKPTSHGNRFYPPSRDRGWNPAWVWKTDVKRLSPG